MLSIVLITAMCLLFQLPSVQTAVISKLCDTMTSFIDADISIERLGLRPFNTLIIKNISITDKHPYLPEKEIMERMEERNIAVIDTLFHSDYITARFSLLSLLSPDELRIFKLNVRGADINLVIEKGRNNMQRMFKIHRDRIASGEDGVNFHIDKVKVSDTRFTMTSYKSRLNYRKGDYGIKWDDLDVNDIFVTGKNIGMKDGIMKGICTKCSFNEKSGYVVHSVSGSAAVGKGQVSIKEAVIDDEWSHINLPVFIMSYNDGTEFKYYVDKVLMQGVITDSYFDAKSLSYFAPAFKNTSLKGRLNADVLGTVRALALNSFSFITTNNDLDIRLRGSLKGLPDLKKAMLDINVDKLATTSKGIERFLKGMGRDIDAKALEYLPEGVRFNISSRLHGMLNQLKAELSFNSTVGDLNVNSTINNMAAKDSLTTLEGNVTTKDLNIGAFLGNDIIKECSMDSHLKANIGKKGIDHVAIDSIMIRRLNVNDYNYSKIGAVGTLTKDFFKGTIVSQDPSLNFLFQGLFTFSPKTSNAVYQFYANVGHADLHAMNIDKRETSNLSFRMNANFNYTGSKSLLGSIGIADLVLESPAGVHDIGDIKISSNSNDDKSWLNFTSSFALASFTGSGSIGQFVEDVLGMGGKTELPALYKDPSFEWSGNNYLLDFKCINTSNVTAFFNPDLYVDNNTTIRIAIDGNGKLDTKLKSRRLAIRSHFLKDLDCTVNNDDGKLKADINCTNIRLLGVSMENGKISLRADNDSLSLDYKFVNPNNSVLESGNIAAIGHISKEEDGKTAISADFLPSGYVLDNEQWRLAPNHIELSSKGIAIKGFNLRYAEDGISIDGAISKQKSDTLAFSFNHFKLESLEPMFSEKNITLGGTVNGDFMILSEDGENGIFADLTCDSTYFSGCKLGDIKVNNVWNGEKERYDISLKNEKTLNASGTYNPMTNWIDLRANLDSLDISFAQPFLSSVFNEMGGSISGQFDLTGMLSDFQLSSKKARFNKTKLSIDFTGVPYWVDGDFRMDEYGVYFDNVGIIDKAGHQGQVKGDISYNHFKNLYLDTQLNIRDMELVNLKESQAKGFYGNIFGSGDVSLKGYLDEIQINVNAMTSGRANSVLRIPLGGSSTGGVGDILTFNKGKEEEIDPYEVMMENLRIAKEKTNNLAVKVNVVATPDMEGIIEFDKGTGNVLYGRGNGNILINVVPSKDILDFKGDYTINSGSYKFIALGIASRDFTIQEGSQINFNGDIMNSTLDIDALYKTKANVSTLISDTTSVNSRRSVECGIKITDRLSNPNIALSINVPDLDPTSKSKVESALNTEDKIQKQFLSLIISNNFLPDERSGIVNNSSILYSNMSVLMARQLNNIFEKLDIPLDLGLNYQPDNKGRDIFDVAISTKLFNNRVSVNGNIGNRQFAGSKSSDIVGDIDIEVKLDKPGAVRLNLFSHSADQYSKYLDNTQRNGIGIMYQKEFNDFKSLIQNILANKKKKEEMLLEEIKQENVKMKTIKIKKKGSNAKN